MSNKSATVISIQLEKNHELSFFFSYFVNIVKRYQHSDVFESNEN